MKTIKVVAAVIFRTAESGKKEIFATQRGYGEFKDWWEFPGGKIEEGETPQQALTREIKEELDAEISVGDCIGTVEYDYPASTSPWTAFTAPWFRGIRLLPFWNTKMQPGLMPKP